MKMSVNIDKIAPAVLAAQMKMGDATKGSKNPFFKSSYADLNSIREAVMPALHEEGITVLQPIINENGKSFVQTTLLHISGQYIASQTEIVAAKQNDPQALGSAISYARRYDLQSLVSCAAVDDDGEQGMGRGQKNTPPKQESVGANPPIDNVPVKKASFLKKKEEPKKEEAKEDGSWE